MQLYSISTNVQKRQSATKFSPGLPHNQTCGCWRGGNQTNVIDMSLNASWIVSGLTFKSDRRQWLKRFTVAASGDNITFLEWGTYNQSNHSSAMVLFRYPIRTTFLRLTVHEYVNHMINETAGFPVKINALVSNSEPFGCDCASLPTGECCPLANMEVKNGVCVLCMDPSSINTIMVDGCGRCKPGTRPVGSSQKCAAIIPIRGRPIALNVSNVTNDRNEWLAQVEVDPGDSAVILFMARSAVDPSSNCLAVLMKDYTPLLWDLDLSSSNATVLPFSRITREMNPQYLQFDRGRLLLALNESTIRSWAQCGPSQCTGNLVGVFVFDNRFTVINQPLSFELVTLRSNALVCGFSRGFTPVVMELHHHIDTGQYLLWPPSLRASEVQWNDDSRVSVGEDGKLAQSPPQDALFSMRVFAGDKQYFVSAPVIVKEMHSLLSMGATKDSVRVRISYGLALKEAPEPGDTEQLVTISAESKQPIRLARLASVAAEVTTVYTAASKGFITDSARALDLVVACNMDTGAMIGWLGSALGLMDHRVEPFVLQACERSRKVSKLYWLVPHRPIGTRRNERVDVKVSVDFV